MPVLYRQEMVHCTIYDCIDIDKQSSYSLALMSQVKAFNTLGDYRSLCHHFMQCVWPDYWSWILSSTSYIMNSCYYILWFYLRWITGLSFSIPYRQNFLPFTHQRLSPPRHVALMVSQVYSASLLAIENIVLFHKVVSRLVY